MYIEPIHDKSILMIPLETVALRVSKPLLYLLVLNKCVIIELAALEELDKY